MNIFIAQAKDGVDPDENDEVGEDWVRDAENFTYDELRLIYDNTEYYSFTYMVGAIIDGDNIKSIGGDFCPEEFFNNGGYKIEPNFEIFKFVTISFMERLFIIWDRDKLYIGNRYYQILRVLYKEYIEEAAIRDVIE